MPANMRPYEFGATVAKEYIAPSVVRDTPEPVVETVVEPEIKPEPVKRERTARITIAPEVIAEAAAPAPKIIEEDVVPYKL